MLLFSQDDWMQLNNALCRFRSDIDLIAASGCLSVFNAGNPQLLLHLGLDESDVGPCSVLFCNLERTWP